MSKVLLYYLSRDPYGRWYDVDIIETRIDRGECVQLHEALGYLAQHIYYMEVESLPVKVTVEDDAATILDRNSGGIIIRVHTTYIDADGLRWCYDLGTIKRVLSRGIPAEAIESIARGIGA